MLLVLRLSGPRPDFWSLTGPLPLAGLGNGLVIAPNQDLVLASVPREQAGTAGGALITAQQLGSAIGIAVVGTELFGSGSAGSGPGSAAITPSLVHSAQSATAVNLCFTAAALLCAFGLPRRLASQGSGQSDDREPGLLEAARGRSHRAAARRDAA